MIPRISQFLYLDSVISPDWNKIIKKTFGLIGLIYSARCFQLIEFNFHIPSEKALILLQCAHLLWSGLCLLTIFNCTHFFVGALQFLVSSLLLNHNLMPHTLELVLYCVISFWLPWVDFRKRTHSPRPAWPYFLLGLNILFGIFGSGLKKYHDPVWSQHIGFSYAFSLPYKYSFLNSLSSTDWLAIFLNDATIALQISALPLFLFRQTRLVGILLSVLFFSGLIFPFRLQFIGAFGLIGCLGMMAAYYSHFDGSEYGKKTDLIATRIIPISFFTLGFFLAVSSLLRFVHPGRISNQLNKVSSRLSLLNSTAMNLVIWEPFTQFELEKVFVYKIRFHLVGGEVKEPLVVFNENQTIGGGIASPFPMVLPTCFLTEQMYFFSNLKNKNKDKTKALSDLSRKKMASTLRYFASKLDKSSQNRIEKIEILLSPITQPPENRNARVWFTFLTLESNQLQEIRADYSPIS